MVPNAPGSGYDITARTIATALDNSGIRRGVEVFNLPGGQGAVGLQRLVYERGNGTLMMLMGLGLVGAQLEAGLPEITPIARLISEPEILVVTPDSPLRTIDDLVAAWQRDPDNTAVGGGSARGGPDHLAPMLIARAIGVEPKRVNYQQYDGGGALLAAILSRQVTFAVSSVGEWAGQIDKGQLRVLAVTGDERITGVRAPTLRQAGVDVVFANWRGLVAPPGLSTHDSSALADLTERLRGSADWREAIAGHRWSDAYLAGPGFGSFLRGELTRVSQVLGDLGLGVPSN